MHLVYAWVVAWIVRRRVHRRGGGRARVRVHVRPGTTDPMAQSLAWEVGHAWHPFLQRLRGSAVPIRE